MRLSPSGPVVKYYPNAGSVDNGYSAPFVRNNPRRLRKAFFLIRAIHLRSLLKGGTWIDYVPSM